MGKDLGGAPGVNGGVAFVRRSAAALRLLGAWWSWPDRGDDGELDARQKWKVDFPFEQLALNGVGEAAGVLHEGEVAACLRVVPTRELFLPGHRIAHFTGPCRLAPRYEPSDGSYLGFGPTRKCRCFLSHFGAAVVARLAAAPALDQTACRRQQVEVAPPRSPHDAPRGGGANLTVTYVWHGCKSVR